VFSCRPFVISALMNFLPSSFVVMAMLRHAVTSPPMTSVVGQLCGVHDAPVTTIAVFCNIIQPALL